MTKAEALKELSYWLETIHNTERLTGRQCSQLFNFLSLLKDYVSTQEGES